MSLPRPGLIMRVLSSPVVLETSQGDLSLSLETSVSDSEGISDPESSISDSRGMCDRNV